MSTTADLLECLRKRHKLTQSEIARRTGIPQPRLSRWENGDVPDAADDSLKLADLVDQLGTPPVAAEPARAEG
jgi:transcriptional regulator with XRE-family HTH domain